MALPGCNWALKLLSHATGLVDKAFGSLTYDMSLSEYREDYRISDFENSILETEGIS
jgi:UDP-glucose 4-epimerase